MNELKLFIVKDKITDKITTVYAAENKKACVRDLALMGFFKVNRLEDTEINESGKLNEMPIYEEVDIKKTLKELSIEMENKAEKINGTEREVEEKIKKSIEKLDEGIK